MSTVLHGVAISRPSLCCMSSVDNIEHFWCHESRDVEQMKATKTFSEDKVKEAALRSAWGSASEHQNLLKVGK